MVLGVVELALLAVSEDDSQSHYNMYLSLFSFRGTAFVPMSHHELSLGRDNELPRKICSLYYIHVERGLSGKKENRLLICLRPYYSVAAIFS